MAVVFSHRCSLAVSNVVCVDYSVGYVYSCYVNEQFISSNCLILQCFLLSIFLWVLETSVKPSKTNAGL